MTMNWLEATHHQMEGPVCAGQKLVVVGGSSGMGRQTAADVVAAGGGAVIIAEDAARVDGTVQTLANDGTAYGITADLTDRIQAERVCQRLAALTRNLAPELAPHQIRVNTVGPAVVATPDRGRTR